MRGCQCCGQVPGVLALLSSGVRDGSMTMGFLAFFYCLERNRLFNAVLHAAERLDSAGMASV